MTFDSDSGNEPSYQHSIAIFRESPEKAIAGQTLVSAEGSPEGLSTAILGIIESDREKFLYLISLLSPVIQDIFIQYYLLGRTYAQIGAVLFPRQTQGSQAFTVQTGNRIGLRALCAVIKFGGEPTKKQAKKFPELALAYTEMQKFQNAERGDLEVAASSILGDFVVPLQADLAEFFSPSWSVMWRRGMTG